MKKQHQGIRRNRRSLVEWLWENGHFEKGHTPGTRELIEKFNQIFPDLDIHFDESGQPKKTRPRWVRRIHNKLNLRKANKPQSPSGKFYESREWLKIRYVILRRYGAKCQCCGVTAKDGAILQVDHIKPRSKYPELELDEANLQVLCRDCNLGKLNLDETDWREEKPQKVVFLELRKNQR